MLIFRLLKWIGESSKLYGIKILSMYKVRGIFFVYLISCVNKDWLITLPIYGQVNKLNINFCGWNFFGFQIYSLIWEWYRFLYIYIIIKY